MAVINVVVSIPLAQRYGGIGAALGTAISYVLGNGVAINIVYQKKIGLDILSFWKSILSFIPGLIAPVIAGIFIFKFIVFTSIVQFGIWIIIYIAIYAVSMWLFGINEYEKGMVKSMITKLIRRKH